MPTQCNLDGMHFGSAGDRRKLVGAFNGGAISHVSFDESSIYRKRTPLGVNKVVEDGNGMALREQQARNSAADVACSACDENVL